MSRTEIPVYTVNRTEYDPYAEVAGDVGNGMYFADNHGNVILTVRNSGGTIYTVGAVIAGNAVDEIDIPNKDLSVDPGSTSLFGPFPVRYYNQDNLDVYIEAEHSALMFRAFEVP